MLRKFIMSFTSTDLDQHIKIMARNIMNIAQQHIITRLRLFNRSTSVCLQSSDITALANEI